MGCLDSPGPKKGGMNWSTGFDSWFPTADSTGVFGKCLGSREKKSIAYKED